MMPSYFIAHGAPSIVLEQHAYTDFLKNLGANTPKPKAIVIFSAHWEQQIQTVSAVQDTYSTIYDFGGFPDELYRMTYPAKGAPAISDEIQSLFTKHGIQSQLDGERGLDHGAWAILKLIYPEADIPVVALSVNRHLSNEQQYKIGAALAELREHDVLIIGSGGSVHNLFMVNWQGDGIDEWALAFDNWLQSKIESWDTEAMFNYRELAPYAKEAVPTSEHFIPLLIAMGTGDKTRQAKLLHRSYQLGNLSLSCWQF
ncbi:LigB family dioxygenase [compost metagenome]